MDGIPSEFQRIPTNTYITTAGNSFEDRLFKKLQPTAQKKKLINEVNLNGFGFGINCVCNLNESIEIVKRLW